MKSLKDLYYSHSGKVTYKWPIYLERYEERLNQYQKLPIKLLEIGILNGGSLEIFSKYFPKAELILGCDIKSKCGELKYEEPNIKVIVGDVNEDKIKKEIIKYSKFDVIIDDGSHDSDDIVIAFCNYFNHLKDGGLFIIEDLHCSYWMQHKGGLFYPVSSINFLKKLIDIINYEHWGIQKKKDWLFRGFSANYKMDIENLALNQIHSIEFINSLCFIKKKPSKENKLGKSVAVGKTEAVSPGILELNDKNLEIPHQNNNPWSNSNLLPEEQLALLKK